MLTLDPGVRDGLLVGAVGVSVVCLLAVAVLGQRLRRLRRTLMVLESDGGRDSLVDVVARKTEEVAALRGDVITLADAVTRVRAELADAIRHVAVVRYDAFGDMGGRLSFSAALLDDEGDGIVLTAIHGRTETRSYIKGVARGAGETLSPEEQQAIDHAVAGRAAKAGR